MRHGRVAGHTRILGVDQRYRPLVIRDVTLTDPGTGAAYSNAMESVWYPSAAEIRALVGGEPVRLRILGTVHPPMAIFVGMNEAVEEMS